MLGCFIQVRRASKLHAKTSKIRVRADAFVLSVFRTAVKIRESNVDDEQLRTGRMVRISKCCWASAPSPQILRGIVVDVSLKIDGFQGEPLHMISRTTLLNYQANTWQIDITCTYHNRVYQIVKIKVCTHYTLKQDIHPASKAMVLNWSCGEIHRDRGSPPNTCQPALALR